MSKKSPDQIDVTIGANVRRVRNLRRMSQEALGERLGITFQQVQKYEKGTNRIGGSRLQQIADALEVSVTEFFPETSTVIKPLAGLSPVAVDVARAVDALPEQNRLAALRVIRAMAA